jgi:sugar-specific transcriptional regulator TrmB
LTALAERRVASASELANASGVAFPVVYPLLKTLEEQGDVVKQQLPSGTAGYRPAPERVGASAH